jgi:anaerobic selenocysteine-containing dehydrogenase
VEINPEDANPLGIKSGDRIRIRSRRGEVEAVALVSEDTPKGVLTMSFHFPETRTNLLFSSSLLDPISKMPELKVIAVRIEKV